VDILLTDPRLQKAGWHVTKHSPLVATIHEIGDDGKPSRNIACRVAVAGDQLAFIPERSSAQRKVLARMGIGGGR
jgi:hypothetical protein